MSSGGPRCSATGGGETNVASSTNAIFARGWHAARRIFAFALMIRDGIAVDEVEPYLHARAWLTDLRPEADHPER
jgi:hypothetical protein